jgi:hypothetical protein
MAVSSVKTQREAGYTLLCVTHAGDHGHQIRTEGRWLS